MTRDTFRKPCVSRSGLSEALEQSSITDVFVVGLARDVCVKHTALHAAEDGFKTYMVAEATASVDQGKAAEAKLQSELTNRNVAFIHLSEVKDILSTKSNSN